METAGAGGYDVRALAGPEEGLAVDLAGGQVEPLQRRKFTDWREVGDIGHVEVEPLQPGQVVERGEVSDLGRVEE